MYAILISLCYLRTGETPLWSQYNNKEVKPMKKADKFQITIDIYKKVRITKKMVIISVLLVVLLALIMSNCSSETLADIIRSLISIVSN